MTAPDHLTTDADHLTTDADHLTTDADHRSETAMTDHTMQAVVQVGYGRPEDVLRLAEVPRPVPAADEVLVRLRATSVNTPDWITVLGEPRFLRLGAGLRGPRTPIRGTDAAGVVEAVGADVTDLAVGDEVFGTPWTKGMATIGSFCEYAAIPARMLARKPSDVTFVDAGVSVMSGIVAITGMRDVLEVQPGTSVLVNGASGGLGTYMVQVAAAMGAEVIGVCSTRNVELVASLGAAEVVDYTRSSVTEVGRRFDIVIDNVLNHPGRDLARLVAPGGVLVPNSVGQGGSMFGGLPRIAWTTIRGLVTRPRVRTISYEVDRPMLDDLGRRLSSGDLRAVVDRTYDLADTAEAVSHMAGHHAAGKVAIRIP